jgi:hypothetical protein
MSVEAALGQRFAGQKPPPPGMMESVAKSYVRVRSRADSVVVGWALLGGRSHGSVDSLTHAPDAASDLCRGP